MQLVGEASSENEIVQRLTTQPIVPISALSHRLRNLTVADVHADLPTYFENSYGADLPADRLVFDILEEDDAQSFANKFT